VLGEGALVRGREVQPQPHWQGSSSARAGGRSSSAGGAGWRSSTAAARGTCLEQAKEDVCVDGALVGLIQYDDAVLQGGKGELQGQRVSLWVCGGGGVSL
jgi:hypothetical protein